MRSWFVVAAAAFAACLAVVQPGPVGAQPPRPGAEVGGNNLAAARDRAQQTNIEIETLTGTGTGGTITKSTSTVWDGGGSAAGGSPFVGGLKQRIENLENAMKACADRTNLDAKQQFQNAKAEALNYLNTIRTSQPAQAEAVLEIAKSVYAIGVQCADGRAFTGNNFTAVNDAWKPFKPLVERQEAQRRAAEEERRRQAQPSTDRRTGMRSTPRRSPVTVVNLPGTSIATLIFEVGGLDVSNAAHNASCSGCPNVAGQSAGSDAKFAGVDVRFNLAGLIALAQTAQHGAVRFTDSFVLTGPFMGFRVRRYFDQSGQEVAFDFHPTAGLDTFIAYQALWSYKTYIGLQFIWLNPFGAAEIAAMGISPYVGVNFERGRTRLRSDESGGGGVANTFESTTTRSGTAVGVDLDWHFRNLPFFIGLGLQWDFMPEVTVAGISAINNFDYAGRIAERTSFTANARIGIPLGGGNAAVASDIRLKRDIARVGTLDNGLPLYRYKYLWSDQVYVGVMAQETAAIEPDAVIRGENGYLRVNYARLGTQMKTWEQWNAERGWLSRTANEPPLHKH
jgi:hypothetical protein